MKEAGREAESNIRDPETAHENSAFPLLFHQKKNPIQARLGNLSFFLIPPTLLANIPH